MRHSGPSFTVLYRWVLRAGMEEQFVAAWSRVTLALREEGGSLGSRLHRGPDGIWYGYAQWPSAVVRERAFDHPIDTEARRLMREAIEQDLPELVLESVSDYLVLPYKKTGG